VVLAGEPDGRLDAEHGTADQPARVRGRWMRGKDGSERASRHDGEERDAQHLSPHGPPLPETSTLLPLCSGSGYAWCRAAHAAMLDDPSMTVPSSRISVGTL
jgi:hypothetical protein